MSYPNFPNAAPVHEVLAPLYFLHIPKTAGTTFNRFLASHFRDEEVCPAHLWRQLVVLPESEVSSKRLIWGHFYSFLFTHLPNPMRYLVFLRDPVDRALSHYGHVLLDKGHYFHQRALELGSFGAYLRDPETRTTVENFQVRSLALDLNPHAIASRLTPEELSAGELERRLLTTPFDRQPHEMLETAKIRLRQMCFVGITERYDDSIDLFCRRFHWPRPGETVFLNVNEGRPRQGQISEEELKHLRQINRADYDLYNFACQLFSSELSSGS